MLLEHDALVVADPRTGCDRRLDDALALAVADLKLAQSAQRRRATREEASAGARAHQRVPAGTAVTVGPALVGAQAHRAEDKPQSRRGASGGRTGSPPECIQGGRDAFAVAFHAKEPSLLDCCSARLAHALSAPDVGLALKRLVSDRWRAPFARIPG